MPDEKIYSSDLGNYILGYQVDPATRAFAAYVRPVADNVREHVLGNRRRVVFTTSSQASLLPPLGACREIYVYSNAECYFATGDGSIVASAALGHDLNARERWYLRVPEGHTHIAIIGESAGGTLSIVPVAG